MKHEQLQYAHDEGHTDVCYSSDGSKFVTCGADGDIRIWSAEEGEDPIHNCVGEWALSVRQKDDFLLVATGSNDIQKLTFPEGERNGVLYRFVAPINHIALSKTSERVALAGEDMEVKLYDMTDSKNVTVFSEFKGPCLSVALSPNDQFLAVSCGDGNLTIWNITTKGKVHEVQCFPKVNSFSNAENLCRIDFDSSSKLLAYPEKNTIKLLNVGDWSGKGTLCSEDVTAEYSIVQFSPCGSYILGASIGGDFVVFKLATKSVFAKSKHESAKAICGLNWNPLNNGQVVYTDVEGQLGLISDCITSSTNREPEDAFDDNEVDFTGVQFEDDADEDNENAVSLDALKRQVMGDDADSELNFDDKSSRAASPRASTPDTPLQPAFMPSSTPEHLSPRYLCWNEVGVVRSYSDDAMRSLEVDFHDTTFHSSMVVQNYSDYAMAALSKAALIVANTSQVHVIPLAASNKEWNLALNEPSVEILLVAASEKLVAFVTSGYMVRVCSIFGTQRGVVAICGPPLSMAAFGSEVLVAYHAGAVRGADQCVGLKLFTFRGLQVASEEFGAALGPGAGLQWLGFSDLGRPALMDSLGLICIYANRTWIPICDTTRHRKSPSDGFFISCVLESYQTVCGIACKGSNYPGFTPRPICTELPLEAPFVEFETEKTQMEANLFTWANLQAVDIGRKVTETALKTFALALRNGYDQRGIELVEILENPQIYTLAPKYAMKLNKRQVAEKLMELAAKMMESEDEDTTVYPSMSTNVATPELGGIRRKLTLSSMKKTNRIKLTSQDVLVPTASESQLSALTPSDNLTDTTNISTLSTTFEEQPVRVEQKNPFLKSSKKAEDEMNANPLSLTNKFAGVEFTETKENKSSEKRKQPDSDTSKQKEKQRKLDKFMFSSTSKRT